MAQESPRDGSPLLALRLAELVRHHSHGVREPSRLRTLAEQLMATIQAFVTGHPRNVVSLGGL
jgi:hypothetical protein